MIDKLKTWIKKQTHAERERKIQDLKNKRRKNLDESTAKAKKKKKEEEEEEKKPLNKLKKLRNKELKLKSIVTNLEHM